MASPRHRETRHHETRVDFIWNRIVAGDRVRIFQDFYGGQWIELTRRFAFWRKTRIRVSPHDMAIIVSAIRESRQIDARRIAVSA